jgi:signal transduction histidine kinase
MNAVQSIRDHGEVRVRVQTAHRAPENAAAKTSDPYLVLIVEDNGIGIAKDSLQRIFEPFFTTQRAGEGTGLGLSITSEIIADHGGFIEVESEPWKGSRFAVYLPKGKLE